MEKNVSGVDLEELLKAREALDAERGVATDPNLYSDYNPNRDKSSDESKEESLENVNNYDNITNNDTKEEINSQIEDISSPDENMINPESTSDENIVLETEIKQEPSDIESLSIDEGVDKEALVLKEPAEQVANMQEENARQNNSESTENLGTSQENLGKFDIFSAFEVKENAPAPVNESAEETHQEDVSNENSETVKTDIQSEANMSDDELEEKLEKIDNAEELEELLSDLLAQLDDEVEEYEEKTIENTQELLDEDESLNDANELDETAPEKPLEEILSNEDSVEEKSEVLSDSKDEEDSFLTAIDIEPKFDNEITIEENSDVEEKNLEEDLSENVLEIKDDAIPLTNSSLEHLAVEPEKDKADEVEPVNNEDVGSLLLDLFNDEKESSSSETNIVLQEEKAQEETTGENNDNLESNETKEDVSETQVEELNDEEAVEEADKDEAGSNEELADASDDVKSSEELAESEETLAESESDSVEESEAEENNNDDTEQTEKVEDKIQDLNEDYITSLLNRTIAPETAPVTQSKPVFAENTISENDVEVITDYSQLRDILQKQLKETAEVDENEFQKKYNFKDIEDFKFIDEIASDGFKDADKFSYILGKNENNEMVYGNFKEHLNLAVFGKTDSVINSFLNSMILSLCLKNSFRDVNFVLLDSDINSPFEVYNKSSYLYFNRIAKTNKEILDTLIEVSKEVDNRYSKFASLGVKNIDSYNEVAVENKLETIPYVIVVFNNYTSASQATDHDRINACLYQILKYGRIAGIYAVVAAKLPIDVNQINYSLSSRIGFKSDDDSTYTVGADGVEFLPSDSDALYYNIATNKTEHLKVSNVTEMELDLIIKDLEE